MKALDAQRLALRLARRNGFVVTRPAALAAGVHNRQLRNMLAAGVLIRLHPGVYVDGGRARDPLVVIRASLVFAGPKALASHRTAAWLQGLVDSPGVLTHVTLPDRSLRSYPGLRAHTSSRLPVLTYKGIRCTTPARTIVDLAATVTGAELNTLVDKALVMGLTRSADLAEEADRRRRGCGALRRSLAELGHIDVPDASVLESEFRRLITRYDLPAPETQVVAGPDGRYRVDNAWAADRVIVEVNGYTWHHSPDQMSHDVVRERELRLEGWTVLVFTWQEVVRDPDRVAQQLRSVLGSNTSKRRLG